MEILGGKEIPDGGFVDIEWIPDIERTSVEVNGELRYSSGKTGYMQAFERNAGFDLSSAVRVSPMCGATVTVGRLRVTEL